MDSQETVVKFIVLGAQGTGELTMLLESWAEKLPPGARIRRTQLCSHGPKIVALVNWEQPKVGQ